MSEIDQLDPSDNDNLKKINQKREIEQLILRLTDEFTENKRLSTKKIERVVELISGQVIGENYHLDLISASIQPYERHFDQEYWDLICKLWDYPIEWGKSYIERSKHKGFADFTNQVIYARFEGSVIRYLQLQNPFIAFAMRRYKLFQFLSIKGQEQMDEFIQQTLVEMRECSSMHKFRLIMLEKYKVAYQPSLFQNLLTFSTSSQQPS